MRDDKLKKFLKDNAVITPVAPDTEFENIMLKVDQLDKKQKHSTLNTILTDIFSFFKKPWVINTGVFASLALVMLLTNEVFVRDNVEMVLMNEADFIELLSVPDELDGNIIAGNWP